MKNTRKPNTQCKVCDKAIYRRPFDIESYGKNLYCSKKCMYRDRKERQRVITCPVCGEQIGVKPSSKQIYCSKRCSGKVTRNRLGTKKGYRKYKNLTEQRLCKLKEVCDFSYCMVQGCEYNRMFHIHRFIEGKNGGKYEVGNMYAICPNHHAEYHHGLIKFLKISVGELAIGELAIVLRK